MTRQLERRNPRQGNGTGFQIPVEGNRHVGSITPAIDQELPTDSPIVRIKREGKTFVVSIDPVLRSPIKNRAIWSFWLGAFHEALLLRRKYGYAILDTSCPRPRMVVDNEAGF